MRRLVWISVAMLICVALLGCAFYSMRHIEEVNQRRRQENAGSEVALRIASTTATTSVWDKLRPTETDTSDTSEDPSESVPPEEQDGMQETDAVSGDALPEEGAPETDDAEVTEAAPAQTEVPTAETVIRIIVQ